MGPQNALKHGWFLLGVEVWFQDLQDVLIKSFHDVTQEVGVLVGCEDLLNGKRVVIFLLLVCRVGGGVTTQRSNAVGDIPKLV